MTSQCRPQNLVCTNGSQSRWGALRQLCCSGDDGSAHAVPTVALAQGVLAAAVSLACVDQLTGGGLARMRAGVIRGASMQM